MSIERWGEIVETKPGDKLRPTFFKSNPQQIKSDDIEKGLELSYLLVKEGDESGLEPGVYAETNTTAESYDTSFILRATIASYVAIDLGSPERAAFEAKIGRLLSIGEGPLPIQVQPHAILQRNKALVLRLS